MYLHGCRMLNCSRWHARQDVTCQWSRSCCLSLRLAAQQQCIQVMGNAINRVSGAGQIINAANMLCMHLLRCRDLPASYLAVKENAYNDCRCALVHTFWRGICTLTAFCQPPSQGHQPAAQQLCVSYFVLCYTPHACVTCATQYCRLSQPVAGHIYSHSGRCKSPLSCATALCCVRRAGEAIGYQGV